MALQDCGGEWSHVSSHMSIMCTVSCEWSCERSHVCYHGCINSHISMQYKCSSLVSVGLAREDTISSAIKRYLTPRESSSSS